MATATENLGLVKDAQSQNFAGWLESINGNWDKIDDLPLPIEHSANSKMDYLKLSDGTVIMWGRIELGTSYPSTTAWGTEGFASAEFTINFPIALISENPIVIPHVLSVGPNVDIWCLSTKVTYTTYAGRLFARTNTASNNNAISLNMLIIGKWK